MPTECAAGVVLTQAQRDDAAYRIEAFLRERKRVGQQRRRQECEDRIRNSERARERYHMMAKNKAGTDSPFAPRSI